MFGVLPSPAMRGNIGIGAIIECYRLGDDEPFAGPLRRTRLDRIAAFALQFTCGRCFLTGFCKRHLPKRAKTHVALAAIPPEAIDPRSPARRDLEIEASTIGVPADGSALHGARRQDVSLHGLTSSTKCVDRRMRHRVRRTNLRRTLRRPRSSSFVRLTRFRLTPIPAPIPALIA